LILLEAIKAKRRQVFLGARYAHDGGHERYRSGEKAHFTPKNGAAKPKTRPFF